MPGINDLDLAKRFWKYKENDKIVLVTGFLTEENLDNDKVKEGRWNWFGAEKPFHLKDLRYIIKSILEI